MQKVQYFTLFCLACSAVILLTIYFAVYLAICINLMLSYMLLIFVVLICDNIALKRHKNMVARSH